MKYDNPFNSGDIVWAISSWEYPKKCNFCNGKKDTLYVINSKGQNILGHTAPYPEELVELIRKFPEKLEDMISDFEDIINKPLREPMAIINYIYQSTKDNQFHYLIIDEIQYAPELLPYIKTKVDENRQNGTYYLTGSQ